jgi:hypothetical protein
MYKEAAVACLCLTTKNAEGRRFQGLSVRNSECAASRGFDHSDAAFRMWWRFVQRRGYCGFFWGSVQNASFGRWGRVLPLSLSTIPNGALHLHFPRSCNRTVSISWKTAYGAWQASQVCQTVTVIGLGFKQLLLKCSEMQRVSHDKVPSVLAFAADGYTPATHLPRTYPLRHFSQPSCKILLCVWVCIILNVRIE